MSVLKLYYHPLSQPSRAVLALLNIGKIKYEAKIVDLMKGEHKQPEFLAINSFGTVPALTHGSLSLGESNAVLQYLCEAYPKELEKYGGATIGEKALVNQYLSWYQGTFRPALIRLVRLNMNARMTQTKLKKADVADAKMKMDLALDFLEKHLSGGSLFICGDQLTIADLLIFHEATNLETYKADFTKWKFMN